MPEYTSPAEEPLEDDATATEPLPHALAPRPRGTFARRLAIAFATVAAITAALSAALIYTAWNYQFDQYVRGNLQRVAEGVAQVVGEAYPAYGGWTLQTLSAIPRFGPMRGVAVQVLDQQGTLLYDDSASGVHAGLTGDAGEAFVIEPETDIESAQVIVNGSVVGLVRVWAYGPGAAMTDRDAAFRRGSSLALTIAALGSIAFASVAGVWYATRLVRPIEQITATAAALRGGERDARTRLSGTDEIAELGRTFDEMADAIEADRQLERRLTADVAHELRTPLQAIQATVEAMQDGVLPADEERLGVVRNETVRLGRLAEAILELTRLERGSLPFDLRRIDAAAPVRAAIDAHEALVESSGLVLSADVADGVRVNADSDRLQQAIGNLLSNACRYTPAGGRIAISLRAGGDEAFIAVSDTGTGIAETDVTRVFGRFWRADGARASATGGLGIGLAVTKEIVDRHGGAIGVESRLGEGTTFTIRLPIAG